MKRDGGSAVKFGIFYEHQIPRPWGENSEYDQFRWALEQVELADRLGYDYAWQVEHHFLEEYSHGSAPSVFLAAASQRTQRIRLGHGVFQLTTNHPIRVAEQAATLDLLSRGRVELGTGEGAGGTELHPFRARVRSKRQMWEEGIRALVPCFVEQKLEFHGEFWDWPARNVLPKPYQKPHPPLWVACSNLSTIEMAARRGIGALGFQFASPDGARAWVNRYYNLFVHGVEKLANYQANPNLAVVSGFMCAPTDEEARAKADGWTFFIFCLEYNAKHDYAPGTVHLWEEYQEWKRTDKAARAFESGLIGSPETIRKKLRAFADTHLDQIILLNQAGKTSHEDICDSLKLFAEEVMPEFHEREAEHQRWKEEVLEGRRTLEDLSTREHALPAVAVANPELVNVRRDGTPTYRLGDVADSGEVRISPRPLGPLEEGPAS
jgi:alkanesulfonate monooxygenase SsuD/methylene tetrahydromethanopterin reductase-like flavin-dependent oxidoreductase (luciferase family)